VAESTPGFGRIFGALAAFLVVGTPLTYAAWHNLSDLIAGHGTFGGTLLAAGALGLFAVLIFILKRWVTGLESVD
jgi:hypothetical protein